MIWKEKVEVAKLNDVEDTLASLIGVEFLELGDDFISAKMPVDKRTMQPAGIMHGGASVVLAETLGSVASNLIIDQKESLVVGQEINANHLRPVSSGFVVGTCRPIHIGRKSHVWDIRIENQEKKLVCVSRLTVAVLAR